MVALTPVKSASSLNHVQNNDKFVFLKNIFSRLKSNYIFIVAGFFIITTYCFRETIVAFF